MYIFIDELLHLFWFLAHFPQVHYQKNHTGPYKQGSTLELTDSAESLQVSKPEIQEVNTLEIVLGYLLK